MNSLLSIFLLSARVVLASVIGLGIQLYLLVRNSELLLDIQEAMKDLASSFFSSIQIDPQYHVGYNLIGGDNIVVHTLFVLVAYILILVVLLPFRTRTGPRRKNSYRDRSRRGSAGRA